MHPQATQVLAPGGVGELVARERRIADRHVKRAVRGIPAREVGHLHALVRIQVLCDGAGNGVALDAGKAAAGEHVLGRQADEVADPAAGLKEPSPAFHAQARQRLIHGTDHVLGRVVRELRGIEGVLPLVRRQSVLQLAVLGRPLLVVLVEGLRNAAPANIARQHMLLVRRGAATLGLQRLDQADRREVVAVLGLLSAFAQLGQAGDAVVAGRLRIALYWSSLPRLDNRRLISS